MRPASPYARRMTEPLSRQDRLERLDETAIYLVVTPDAHGPAWEDALARALDTGLVGMVQLREKTVDDATVLRRAEELRRWTADAGALLILNDRVHLARQAAADGVHVGEADMAPERARALLGPDRLLGVSTHDEREVAEAGTRGADHAGLGPCFSSTSKKLERAAGGPELVRRCLRHAGGLPVFPIGGVTPANAAALAAAGARRVAVGAGVLEARDVAVAVRTIHRALVREVESDAGC